EQLRVRGHETVTPISQASLAALSCERMESNRVSEPPFKQIDLKSRSSKNRLRLARWQKDE
ncbi:MAG: hypothetical protein RR740_15120, partial [Pseudomonas sp.]